MALFSLVKFHTHEESCKVWHWRKSGEVISDFSRQIENLKVFKLLVTLEFKSGENDQICTEVVVAMTQNTVVREAEKKHPNVLEMWRVQQHLLKNFITTHQYWD